MSIAQAANTQAMSDKPVLSPIRDRYSNTFIPIFWMSHSPVPLRGHLGRFGPRLRSRERISASWDIPVFATPISSRRPSPLAHSCRAMGCSRAVGALSASCSSVVAGHMPVAVLPVPRIGGCCPYSGASGVRVSARRGVFDERS
jgi:hypothetical protein